MPKLTVLAVLMLAFYQRPQPRVLAQRPDLSALARQANVLMGSGDLPRAEALFRQGLTRARYIADGRYISGFLTSLGVVRVHQARYRHALEYFLESQDAARQAGAVKEAALAAANIGVIYTRLGDWQKGHTTMLTATREMPPDQLPSTLPHNLADYESRLRHYAEADRYYRLSIENTERAGLMALAAAGWEHWGLSYLERGQLPAAEVCLLESYRQHRLAKRADAEQIHYGLARLALAQGDLPEARRRADQYLRAARAAPLLYPLWEAYRVSAEIEERAGRPRAAYQLYLRGVDWARQSRAERLPTAQLMATAESALRSLYLGLIRTVQKLNEHHQDSALLLTALEVAEEGRDTAFTENTPQLSDDYWQTLDRLQRIQAQRLAQDRPELESQSESLSTRLVQLESDAGLRVASPRSHRETIAAARNALGSDEAILVFRTGEPRSYFWIVTRNDVQLRALPGERQLKADITAFRADLLAGRAINSKAGRNLFSEIIGEFSLSETTIKRWILVPDGPLHELPIAALPWPANRSGIETYLVEHRSLFSAPSIATVATDLQGAPASSSFAGLADPIYNLADPRLRPTPQRAAVVVPIHQEHGPAFELARLPGSRAELDAAVKVLPPGARLLTGEQVNRQSFLAILDRPVDTLHLSTHVVEDPGNPRHALIALGLNSKTREQELVGADDINARRNVARLVVMSGCGSGRGEALPGAGLLSLTRAWIFSGAKGVIGSHWPVPDNSGPLFERFYRYAHHTQRAHAAAGANDWALALQHAQIDSIRDRVPASIWAAYFLTGRN